MLGERGGNEEVTDTPGEKERERVCVCWTKDGGLALVDCAHMVVCRTASMQVCGDVDVDVGQRASSKAVEAGQALVCRL